MKSYMRKEKGKITADVDSIGFFDFARGIGIIGVLMGHSILLWYPMTFTDRPFGNLNSVIGSSIMAMFFMISGYGFQRRKMKKCLKTQAKVLLKPYWISVSCIIGMKLLLAFLRQRSFWKFGGQYIFSYLFAINAGVAGNYGGKIFGLAVDDVAMMWFFVALFGGWVLCNAITKVQNIRIQFCLVFLCLCVGIYMTYISDIWPFVLPQIFQAAGLLFVGYIVKKHYLLVRRLPIQFWLIGGSVVLVSAVWGGVDMYTCVWKLGLLDYASIVILGFIMMYFFSRLETRGNHKFFYDFIVNIGGKTQIILCIHAFDEKVLPWHWLKEYFKDECWFGCIVSFTIRCVFVFCAYQIVKYINVNFIRKWRKKRKHIQLNIQI